MEVFKILILVFLFVSCFASNLNSCETDLDCTESLGLRNQVCNDNVCKCHEDFYINPSTGHCELLHQRLAGPCGTDSDCERLIPNAWCNVGSCSCSYGYQANSDMRSCFPVLGTDCENNQDCPGVANYCHTESKTCQCPEGQYYQHSVGRCSPLPDGPKRTCANNATCAGVPNSYCSHSNDRNSGICRCNFGYLETSGGGGCVKPEDTECEEDLDCVHLSNLAECHSGHCMCGDGEEAYLHPTLNYCYKTPTQITQSKCHTDHECRNVPGSECRNEWCLCKPNYFEASLTECIFANGKECSEDSECSSIGPNLECRGDKCACGDGYYFSNMRSECDELSSGYLRYCEADEHCVNHKYTSCVNRECECNEGLEEIYSEEEDHFICVPPFGIPSCEKTEDCEDDLLQCVANREQTSKYCDCKQKYALQLNSTTGPFFCMLPIHKSCGFAGIPKNICNDHLRDSYCKVLRDGPDWWDYLAVCTCDDTNGFYYNALTQTCDKI